MDTDSKCLDTCEQTLLGDLVIGERTPCAAQDHYGVIKDILCRRSHNVLSSSIVIGTRQPKISPSTALDLKRSPTKNEATRSKEISTSHDGVKCLQAAEILFKDTILEAQRKYSECIKKAF